MRYFITLFTVFSTLSLLTAPSFAESDSRKGFVIGGGLGPGFVNISSTLNGVDSSESRVGAALNIDLGWGFSEQLVLHIQDRQLWFQLNGETTLSEVIGLGATYFFTEGDAPSFLATVGGGLGLVVQPSSDLSTQRGFGVVLGAGYEFSPHFIVEVDGAFNSPGDFETVMGLAALKYLYY